MAALNSLGVTVWLRLVDGVPSDDKETYELTLHLWLRSADMLSR